MAPRKNIDTRIAGNPSREGLSPRQPCFVAKIFFALVPGPDCCSSMILEVAGNFIVKWGKLLNFEEIRARYGSCPAHLAQTAFEPAPIS